MANERMRNAADFNEYVSFFPEETQKLLIQLRETIKQSAPEAEEKISYGMPAFKQNGVLVYFAAYSGHIGFYPSSSGITAFKDELSGYKISKGTIQFPLKQPLPLDLVTRIIAYRVNENLLKAQAKRKNLKTK